MTDKSSERGRVAGIDYGTVRIGIAISDPLRMLSSPYENYDRRSPSADAARMQRLVTEEEVCLFVVGLPIHLDGRESQKSREARKFAHWLREVSDRAVELFDERFTTAHAHEMLAAADVHRGKRKKRLDMVAAQVLLAAYLEAGCPRGRDDSESLD